MSHTHFTLPTTSFKVQIQKVEFELNIDFVVEG